MCLWGSFVEDFLVILGKWLRVLCVEYSCWSLACFTFVREWYGDFGGEGWGGCAEWGGGCDEDLRLSGLKFLNNYWLIELFAFGVVLIGEIVF